MHNYVKAEQGEGEDHSIIYLSSNGKLCRYINGHWNWRANNPGNIHVGSISKRHQQIGVVNKLYCRNLAIFPSYDIGYEALIDNLQTNYMNFSLYGLPRKWAPQKDHNNPAQYEKDLRKATGINDNRPIKQFTTEQFNKLVNAIIHEEGGRKGQFIDVHIITHVHKKNNEIFEYYIEEFGWIGKEKCIELANEHKIDAYVINSKLGNSYVRSRTNSSFQEDFEKLVEK